MLTGEPEDGLDFDKVEFSSPRPGLILMNHAPTLCAGTFCCIHNPSDHHMRDWKMVFRTDRPGVGDDGRTLILTERLCPCGVGHPDPDSLAYLRQHDTGGGWGIHGCCGCCRSAKREN